jgi:flagellar biogenesis protein FliO
VTGVDTVSSEIFEYLKVIAILAGVALFALIALRLWLPKLTGAQGAGSGPMSIAWRLTLEPRKTLYIVRAGSDYLLLSSSDAGIQFLTSLDPERIEADLQKLSDTRATGFDFASLMRGRRQRHERERAE